MIGMALETFVLIQVLLAISGSSVIRSPQVTATKVVQLEQGPVRGRTVSLAAVGISDCEVYLGIPYARPPVGSHRFMPPAAPQKWEGVLEATQFGPVCPQFVPNLKNESYALSFMSRGRLKYMRKLIPYLKNQSEDCLNLNIYTPVRGGTYTKRRLLPVVVFIHGESFEWNSGNPYDGSVFASYTSSVFVTLNFRLGIFGFFRPGFEDTDMANFGLWDLVAALHWIQQTIDKFGGDPHSITLMGQGTGATLVTYLMNFSGLRTAGRFNKAILLSGSAFSPQSLVLDPKRVTEQVAKSLNCRLNSQLINCLRDKSVYQLLNAKVNLPPFHKHFGPIVDGIIIPMNPLRKLQENLLDFDVVLGLNQFESIHWFEETSLSRGLSDRHRDDLLYTYIENIYRKNATLILQKVLNEYMDFRKLKDDNMSNRDLVVDAFSDAWVVSPVMELATATLRRRKSATFVYVFEHITKYGPYNHIRGSVHGEDLPFLLGMPLIGGSYHYKMKYTNDEKVLSEIMMNYMQNFIMSGHTSTFSSLNHLIYDEKPFEKVAPTWADYTRNDQTYLVFDESIQIKSHYRYDKVSLWIDTIPRLINSSYITDADTHVTRGVNGDLGLEKKPEDIPGDSDNGLKATTKSGTEYPIQAYLLLLGLALLVVNICACVGVVYQRKRIRERESNIRHELRRLSLEAIFPLEEEKSAGLESCFLNNAPAGHPQGKERCELIPESQIMAPPGSVDCPECQMAESLQNNRLPPMMADPKLGPDSIIIDQGYHSQQFDLASPNNPEVIPPRKFHLPKVLPDFPILVRTDSGCGSKRSSPPNPIIEMIPVSEYEKLHPRTDDTNQVYESFTFPKTDDENPFSHYARLPFNSFSRRQPRRSYIQPRQATTPLSSVLMTSSDSSNYGDHDEGNNSQARYSYNKRRSLNFQPELATSEDVILEDELDEQSSTGEAVAPPILSVIGDKTPPGTLKEEAKSGSSFRDWCTKYSQSYLSKTVPNVEQESEDAQNNVEHKKKIVENTI